MKNASRISDDRTAEPAQAGPVKSGATDHGIEWDGFSGREEGMTGLALIQALVKRLPNAPGVYRMFSAAGDVLYVGKARSIKKRVTSYAQGRGHTARIGRMVRETAAMEFVVTRTETEALLLEANLIKRLRPRFNVLLRDDKSFPYIFLSTDHRAPGIFKHRGARTRKGEYYGPFASAGAVDRTVNALQRAFLLRSCTDSVFEGRTRPCLLYQIKRCSGPCTGEIDEAGYAELVREARNFLSGRPNRVKADIAAAMQKASDELDFERAAIHRDRLAALSHVQSHQGINPQTVEEADLFAIHQEGGQTCVEVFFFRTGQNWGNRAYFPKADPALEAGEVLSSFLAQFYDDKPCPRMILLSHPIEDQPVMEEALSIKAGRKVSLSVPRRGEKKQLIDHALQNAREALGRRLAETSSQARLLEALKTTLELDRAPQRIEVYDNSHIQGAHAIGAMIVAGREGFAKNQYRKFNIRSPEISAGDDFAMMAEVMERRFSRLLKEHGDPQSQPHEDPGDRTEDDDALPAWPDLILIDGGKGQLAAANAVLDRLDIADRLTVVAIAKGADREAGRERFHIKGQADFSLPVRDPVLYFVQRLRDEAHRFAIGSHRAKRKKELVRNPLDEIAGIGPMRKRALLHHFGTAKAVSRAGVNDLVAVEGISQTVAQQIYDHFHDNG